MAKKSMPSKSMSSPIEAPMMDDDSDTPKDYEVDDAVRTLERSEEIKKDKKLMPHVHKKIQKKMMSLAELKKLGMKKASEEKEDPESMS